MHYSLKAAVYIVITSNIDNMNEVINYITTDEFGRYNHPFVEDEAELHRHTCVICNSTDRSLHIGQPNLPNPPVTLNNDESPLKKYNSSPCDLQAFCSTLSTEATLSDLIMQRNMTILNAEGFEPGKSCQICFEEIKEDYIIEDTSHPFCSSCFIEFIQESIRAGRVIPHPSEFFI
jgi:hypothetical protein